MIVSRQPGDAEPAPGQAGGETNPVKTRKFPNYLQSTKRGRDAKVVPLNYAWAAYSVLPLQVE
jgi:hypothetical protein